MPVFKPAIAILPRLCALASVTTGVTVGPGAAAQSPTPACAGIAAPAQRLACYDRVFPPSAQAQRTAQAVQAFGGSDTEARQQDVPGADGDLQDIQARLTGIEYEGSSRTFLLDNGQVWTQTDRGGGGVARAGQTVHIRKALLGSYRLVLPSGVAVRVKRIR